MRFRVPSTARPPLPPLMLLLLMLMLRSVPRSAGRSITWSRSYPGPTAAWPVPDRRHADDLMRAQQLELIEHVLHNDQQWGRVLQQGIKLTKLNRPPYHADDDAVATDPEVRALLRLVDPDVVDVTPLPVLQRAMHFWWLGSYVQYAAYVTRTAFACHAYSIARLAVHLVLRVWDEVVRKAVAAGVSPPKTLDETVARGLPERAVRDLDALLDTMASKMAAVHADLTAMADAQFENANANAGHQDPGAQYEALRESHDLFDEYIDQRCVPITESEAFLNAGFSEARGSVDGEHVTTALLIKTFDRVVVKAIETYDALDVEAVSLNGWAYVMDYDNPAVWNSKPYQQSYHEADPFEVQTNTRLRQLKKAEKKGRRDRQVSRVTTRRPAGSGTDPSGGGGGTGGPERVPSSLHDTSRRIESNSTLER